MLKVGDVYIINKHTNINSEYYNKPVLITEVTDTMVTYKLYDLYQKQYCTYNWLYKEFIEYTRKATKLEKVMYES